MICSAQCWLGIEIQLKLNSDLYGLFTSHHQDLEKAFLVNVFIHI